MKFGAHVSIAGGADKAPARAYQLGCRCLQIFSRSPRGGSSQPLDKQTVADFKKECHKYDLESYIHAPYYINLASSNKRVYYGSIAAIRQELERGGKLGVRYVMAHLGSAKDVGEKKALEMTVEGIKKILSGYRGSTEFLIEMAAGAGMIIGDTFEEIKKIFKNFSKPVEGQVGICFDTQHAFASGYDLRNKQAVKKVFDEFDKILGLKKLKLMHGNDSKVALGSHKDRHEHIGRGYIGREGFRAIVNEPRLQKINMIIETPFDGMAKDLKVLKGLKK